jgi:hypothetical protein
MDCIRCEAMQRSDDVSIGEVKMLNPIVTNGMGKPAVIYGEKTTPSNPVCLVFYHPERKAHLCRRLWLQVLADRPAQVA